MLLEWKVQLKPFEQRAFTFDLDLSFEFESSDGWEMSGSRIWWRVAEWAYWALAITGWCRHCLVSWVIRVTSWSSVIRRLLPLWHGMMSPGLWPRILLSPSSRQESEWLGRDGKLCSECTECTVFTRHGPWLVPGSLCSHTDTHWHPPHSASADIMSAPLQTDNAAVAPPVATGPEAVKQCLFILWLITLKFTAWVWTNRIEQLNGPCSHKWCLFWAQTTKEWFKRVSDNSFKTFEVVLSKIIFDSSLLLLGFGCLSF